MPKIKDSLNSLQLLICQSYGGRKTIPICRSSQRCNLTIKKLVKV